MINVSDEFKRLMNSRTDFIEYAEVTLSDGTVLELTGADFCLSGNTYSDAAGESTLPVGVAISRSVQLEIMNDDEHLYGYDFLGAVIRLYLTLELTGGALVGSAVVDEAIVDSADSRVEKIELGEFTVVEPETYGETVIITANDDMYRADKTYTPSGSFPMSAQALLMDVCEASGILLYSTSFDNDAFSVPTAPERELTARQVIGYIAMLAGGNARIRRTGGLEIIPYSFDMEARGYHELTEWNTLATDLNDITITGVQTTRDVEVVETDDDGNETTTTETQTVLNGEEGYILSFENPLIAGQEEDFLAYMGTVFLGRSMRKFSGEYIAYPIAEFMDLCRITDRKGRVCDSIITDVDFTFFGLTTLSNSVESALDNASSYQSPANSAIIAARKLVQRESTERERAVERLNTLLENASGMYVTEEVQPDGSTIQYLHDKPTLAESNNVIKITSDAIGFSTDGGKTYPYGVTIDGDTIMKIIYAEGINADYVNIGNKTVSEYIADIDFSLSDLEDAVDGTNQELADFAESVTGSIGNLQAQIDGQIETWYYDYAPTLDNYPASEWTTSDEKAAHEGDLFYDKSTGYCYRFFNNGGTWEWTLIQDTDITTAIQKAADAQDTADSKRRVFITTPTPPYDVGDLWTDGTDIWTCTTARASGIFYDGDWEVLNDYSGGNAVVDVTPYFAVGTSSTEPPTEPGTVSAYADAALVDISRVDVVYSSGEWTTEQQTAGDGEYLWVSYLIQYRNGTYKWTDPMLATDYVVRSKVSTLETSFTVIQGEITGKIWMNDIEEAENALGDRISTVETQYTEVVQTVNSITSTVSDLKTTTTTLGSTVTSMQSTITQLANNIELKVDVDGIISAINLSKETVTIDASRINLNGAVTISSLDSSLSSSLSVGETVYYARATSNSTEPTSWSTAIPTLTSTYKYLWSFTETTYADGSKVKSSPGVIGVYGDTGATGATGAAGSNGVGVSSVTNYYLRSSSSSGVTTSTSGWTTTVQTITSTYKYLWNYEVVTYTDNTTASTTPCIIGVYGDTGPEGVGISDITEYYARSTSNSTEPTSWSTSVPTLTSTYKYLWNYEKITYTDGGFDSSAARVIGVYGDTGAAGTDGKDGKTLYGTCSTSASTSSKTVKCSDATELYNGLSICVQFTNASTVSVPALNVNGLGDCTIYFNGDEASSSNRFRWGAGAIITFIYMEIDSTGYWVPQGLPRSYYGTSETAGSTAAKTSEIENFVLCAGTTLTVNFTSGHTTTSNATLNISGTGAQTIYAYGSTVKSTSFYVWDDGASITFSFDGVYWQMTSGTSDGLIARWCYENDKTYIDGGNIYAGTVTSVQINVEDLFAQNITATGEIFFSNSKYKISGSDDDVRIYAYDTLTLVGGANLIMYNEVGYISISSPGEISLTSDYDVVLTARNTGSAGYINLNATNGVKAPSMIQSGDVSITPSAANTPTSLSVTFGTTFPGTPRVVATPQTTVPGTGVTGVGATDISTTGFTLYLTRTNTVTTTVTWIAVYTPS